MKKNFGSAVALVTSLIAMLVGAAMMTGPASAVSSTSAGVTGAATAEEQCGWRLANAPSSVTLTAAGEYELQDLDLTGTADSISAYSTGTDYVGDESGFSDCVMYGDTLSPSVSLAVSTTSVDAVHESVSGDVSMDFDFSSVGSFVATPSGTCANWTTASPITFTDTSTQDLISLAEGSVDSNIERSSGGNQICSQDLTMVLTVPGGTTPNDPGGQYTFRGFSLITELVQN